MVSYVHVDAVGAENTVYFPQQCSACRFDAVRFLYRKYVIALDIVALDALDA